MIIKRWNGSAFVKEFPETKAQLIRNAADSAYIFDGNDKILPAYLPDSVFDSLFFFNTITNGADIRELGVLALQNAASLGRSAIGYYWVATANNTSTGGSTSTAQFGSPQVYATTSGISKAEEGVASSTGVTLEISDWIILTSISGDGTLATPYSFSFSVVNNTYENATTAVDGIVRLSSRTTYASLSGSNVVSEGTLKTVIDNAAFAAGSHGHGNILTGGTISAAVVTPADTDVILISDTSNSGKVERGITIGTSTTTFLNNSGAWTTPTGTYSHPTQTAINIDATNDGITVIDSVVVNTAGHVTSVGTRTLSAATASVPGHMTAAYATKLDGIAVGANAYAHPNHSGDVTSVADGATTIAANSVSNSKLADMTASTIKGRVTASTGDPEDLTASQVRTLINVADGANNYVHPTQTAIDVNATDDGINVIDRVVVNTAGHVTSVTTRNLGAATASVPGHMTAAYATKLDGITAGATNQTALALGGLQIASNAFSMVHPFFVQSDQPATPLTGTIWFDL